MGEPNRCRFSLRQQASTGEGKAPGRLATGMLSRRKGCRNGIIPANECRLSAAWRSTF